MKIEFKVVVNPEEYKDLLPYTNALERDMFLFELFNNFFNQFDSEEAEKIKDLIFELKEHYKVFTT